MTLRRESARQAGTKTKITEEMIEAGIDALRECVIPLPPHSQVLVETVYRAMNKRDFLSKHPQNR